MSDDRILRTLRGQSWERAKGELCAMLSTFWGGHGNDESFRDADKAIKEFIKHVEDYGLHE